ncbi:succinylglutamate desuccinylase/aspartoacylase family protein [Phaeobacter porticola]|uniref:Succinylglutamate desuccinylase / aspartoacylase family protein n=1 Tax=Phaeobacter porticola TaxID=1844006 RepID=A0A1L3I8X0_9RHOB|nr:succinylglutamate desuccinylase/aspartoacylase family protein [Phaeobacter porticola]APG48649.1 succinylglutamate desuccinylase / aspartoacylase family protein [Phaeobacter porticola]
MAKRAVFEIGGEVILPGSRRTVDLPVSALSDHTPVTMSAHVIHGKADGPTMFVSAGVHGDEVIGIEIVRRLLKSSALRGLRGTLIVVPIVNSFGFINRSRYLPDRRDLNRSFPGSEGGSLAARLANLFLTEIVSRADVGIDLHSAAIHRTNYPQVRISPDDMGMRELADAFGAPIIMQSTIREGSLRQAAQDMDTRVLLYEAGEGLRFDELSVRAGHAGILRVLKSLNMISGRGVAAAKATPQFCPSSKWLRAPMGGLFRSLRSDGELVRETDILGIVSDPFGENEQDIAAPFDGIIVGRAVLPVVNEGDAVFHLARVHSAQKAEDAMDNHSSQLADDPMFDEDEII